MATLTGANGAFKFQGRTVAKVRQFDLNLSRDALEDTCVGQDFRTYVPGLIGATGSATVLLDPNDQAGRDMLNTVLTPGKDAQKQGLELVFNASTGQVIEAMGFLTSVSPSVSVGDVQAASVSFQISGSIAGGL